MKFCALASGSSGNCFYIEDNLKNGILIDIGISAKKLCERLNNIGRKPENIKGIFITHEHSDHIKGLNVFARNFNIPIFATKKTIKEKFLCKEKLIKDIGNNEELILNNLHICAYPKKHLAADPVFYTVSEGKKKVSIITDIGKACKNVCDAVSTSDALIIESNHDEKMLEEGPYPLHLKKWIKSDLGHLSNLQAGCCVLEYATKKLKNVILAHLSKINNKPEIAYNTFNNLIKERKDLFPKVFLSEREYQSEFIKV